MRVTVLCFARLRDLAGSKSWTFDLAEGATVRDAWQALAAVRPAVSVMAPALSCAVNADFAPMTAPLHDGDEVAFLPPVSGGARFTS